MRRYIPSYILPPAPGKPVVWAGSALEDLRRFSAEARREAGYQLWKVQQGLPPSDWRPLGTVGAGALEIRIHSGVEHRVFYVAKFEEAVYVLHAFQTRTRQTRRADVDLARTRYRMLLAWRRRPHGG